MPIHSCDIDDPSSMQEACCTYSCIFLSLPKIFLLFSGRTIDHKSSKSGA